MSSLFKKAMSLIVGESKDPATVLSVPKKHIFRKYTERELLQLESKIGATLFGPVAPGRRREFFCLDESTWIWHEEGPNPQTGALEQTTTRYEVHEKGILKVQEGARYSFIEGTELDNLVLATRLYYEKVARDIYHRSPQAGEKDA